MKSFTILLLAMAWFSFLCGQTFDAFERRTFQSAAGDTLPYRILYPENYNPGKQYPLVLFLHGAGERGVDNEKQLTHGARLFLNRQNRRKYPAIVVFPQCPADDYWAHMTLRERDGIRYRDFPIEDTPKPAMGRVLQLLDELLANASVDPDRVYLMGLSMGGMGTFELLARRPEVFAAAVPICGGGNPNSAFLYATRTAIRIFHGLRDDVVLPQYSALMYEAIRAAGGRVQYKTFPNANHNSWDATFAEPDLLRWMFAERREGR